MTIPNGSHFWATFDGKLLVMIRDNEGKFYVCGGWECEVMPEYFEFIELIKMPEGYQLADLYYL